MSGGGRAERLPGNRTTLVVDANSLAIFRYMLGELAVCGLTNKTCTERDGYNPACSLFRSKPCVEDWGVTFVVNNKDIGPILR
jgi:hypothetical protein